MGLFDLTKLFFKNFGKRKSKINTYIDDDFFGNETHFIFEAIELASVGFWEWELESDYVRASKLFYDICGICPGEYKNNLIDAIEALVHPYHKEYISREIETIKMSGSINQLKLKILRPDNEIRWVIVEGNIKKYKNKSIAFGTIKDITKTQKNEIQLYESIDLYQTILDGIKLPIFYKDSDGVYTHCNKSFCDYLQTSRDSVIGHTVFDINPKNLAEIYKDKDDELFEAGGYQYYISKVMQHSGNYRDVEFHKTLVSSGRKDNKGIVGIIHDVTEWKNIERRLKKSLELKSSMLEISQIVLGLNDINNLFEIIIDKALETIESGNIGCVLMRGADNKLRVLSQRGYEESQIQSFELLLEETYAWESVKGKFNKSFIVNEIDKLKENKFPKPLGTKAHLDIKSSISTPIIIDSELVALINVDSYADNQFSDNDLELMDYMKSQVELTLSNLNLYQETVSLSRYDSLTGAYNRSYFDEMIVKFISRAQRYEESFCLVIFDLDQLKQTNEKFGHNGGDRLLKEFVSKVMINARESDFLARHGGDEFIAVFFETTKEEIIDHLEKMNASFMRNCFEIEHENIGCSFSYGIAQFPYDGRDYASLSIVLDQKLSESKRRKRRRITD